MLSHEVYLLEGSKVALLSHFVLRVKTICLTWIIVHECGLQLLRLAPLGLQEVLGHVGRGDGQAVPRAVRGE